MSLQQHVDAVFGGDLAVPATYTSSGNDTNIRVVYRKNVELLAGNAIARVDYAKIRVSEVPEPKRGDIVTIGSEVRRVVEVNGSGTYLWELMLR
jgi:hypothetical protein